MPLEYVGGASVTSGGVTGPMTLSLTALTGGSGSSAQVGDLVIVATGNIGGADNDPGVNSAGYTELVELYADAVRDANLAVAYKRLTTAETSISLTGTGVASNAAGAVVHVWRGADPTTPMDVAVQSATGINSRGVNPPATTPVTTGAVIIAAGILTGTAQMNSTQLSSGYGNPVYITYDPGGAIGLGIASKEWAGGAEDPAQWTGTGGTTGDTWAAVTLAIRPAAAVSGIDGVLAATDATDTVGIAATVAIGSVLSATETTDSASIAVTVGVIATMAATDTLDMADLSANLPVTGSISDIPGLIWSTEASIEYSESGAVVPPISLARASDTPVYCIISVDTVTGHDGAIFSLSNPGTSRWVAQGFTLQRMWQTEAWIEVSGTGTGQLKRLFLPAAPSSHVWEAWSGPDGAVWNETGVAVPQFTNPDMRSPDATTELYIGYIPNNGDPALRGAGTINRMALFNQVPSSADRTRLDAWVVDASPPSDITGLLEAVETPDSATLSGTMVVGAVIAATDQTDTADGSIAAGVVAEVAAVDQADTASLTGSAVWPAIAGNLAAAEGLDAAALSAGVTVIGSLSTQEAPDTAAMAATVVWPSLTASLAATEAADSATLASTVSIVGALAAVETPDACALVGSAGWPGISGVIAATEASDTASVAATVPVRAALAATDAADTAALTGMVTSQSGIVGVLSAVDAPDAAAFSGAVATRIVISAQDATDTVSIIVGVKVTGEIAAIEFPDVSALIGTVASPAGIVVSLAAVESQDTASLAANLGITSFLSAIEASDVTDLTGIVSIGAMLSAIDARDTFSGLAFMQLPAVRFAYPGEARGGRLVNNTRGGVLIGGPRGGTLHRG